MHSRWLNDVLLEKKIWWLISFLCAAGVGVALLSQHAFDMQPCAWCVFQRLIYLTLAVVAALAASSQGMIVRLVCAMLGLSLAIAGVLAAWFQAQVASQSFSCAQTLADLLMTQTGLETAMPALFGIYASCMDARVKVFGLEYAYWSLLLFVLLGLMIAFIMKGFLGPRKSASY
jgi:disulfide bond formation protein DsbB